MPLSLAEVKARWTKATPAPWWQGSNWRRVGSAQGLVAEIPTSVLTLTQQANNAAAIRNAASDVTWLIAEVERLQSVQALYHPLWEESY